MKGPINKAIGSIPPKFTAGFDSGMGFVKALSNALKGEDFEGLGGMAPPFRPLAYLINKMPRKVRESIYVVGTGLEAIEPGELKDIEAEEFSRAVTNLYPDRKYPAIMIGSVSGAMVHMAAAMGIPILPQTFMLPINRPNHLPIDEPKRIFDWGLKPGEDLLRNNPHLKLHHMVDPTQDRLTLEEIAYFRVKMLRMDLVYERFIINHLEEGGTLIVSNCGRKMPVTTVNDRFTLQFGGMGGATEDELHNGSQRVSDFLEKYNSHVRSWDAPEPDSEQPEAEWGFDEALMKDINRIAKENSFKVKEISYYEPEHPSPFVAELYKWWYKKKGVLTNRLVIESFFMHDPYLILKTGSIPFWMKFNMEPSAEWIEKYLKVADPYDEIYMMLFTHGMDSIGLPSDERWKNIIRQAKEKHDFLGVDIDNFPRNLSSMIMYNKEFKSKIKSSYNFKVPLSLAELDEFYNQYKQESFKDLMKMKGINQEESKEEPSIKNLVKDK